MPLEESARVRVFIFLHYHLAHTAARPGGLHLQRKLLAYWPRNWLLEVDEATAARDCDLRGETAVDQEYAAGVGKDQIAANPARTLDVLIDQGRLIDLVGIAHPYVGQYFRKVKFHGKTSQLVSAG